jgi:hypothetical protein
VVPKPTAVFSRKESPTVMLEEALTLDEVERVVQVTTPETSSPEAVTIPAAPTLPLRVAFPVIVASLVTSRFPLTVLRPDRIGPDVPSLFLILFTFNCDITGIIF